MQFLNWKNNQLRFRSLGLLLVGCILIGCNDIKSGEAKAKSDWAKDEILLQLSDLRKEIKDLKSEVAVLQGKLANAAGPPVVNGPQQVQLSSDIAMGDSDAQIAIVEFTDYQCPYCARHNQSVMPTIKRELIDTGKAKYVMYDFPLGFHAQAKPAAVAARCAGQQGKYWEMHDALFESQRQLGLDLYSSAANDLALDGVSFSECLSDPKVEAMVKTNIAYGGQIGVSSTPKFFVGKVKNDVMTDVIVINGAQAFTAFAAAIEKLEKI